MYTSIKRLFDIIIALVSLSITLPIWLPVMIVLRCTNEGDVFYFQQRIGYKNRIFNIWKFVTMERDSSQKLTGELTVRNDPRVTPFGKFLRASKVNELPQIINVLKGEMSIVGPRPQTKRDFDVYTDEVKKSIYEVKPGITGVASIVFRDEEKILSETKLSVRACYEQVIAPYKGKIELWYIYNVSFLTDIQIVFLTAWVILYPKSQLIYKVFKSLPQNAMNRTKYVQKKKTSRPKSILPKKNRIKSQKIYLETTKK